MTTSPPWGTPHLPGQTFPAGFSPWTGLDQEILLPGSSRDIPGPTCSMSGWRGLKRRRVSTCSGTNPCFLRAARASRSSTGPRCGFGGFPSSATREKQTTKSHRGWILARRSWSSTASIPKSTCGFTRAGKRNEPLSENNKIWELWNNGPGGRERLVKSQLSCLTAPVYSRSGSGARSWIPDLLRVKPRALFCCLNSEKVTPGAATGRGTHFNTSPALPGKLFHRSSLLPFSSGENWNS